MHAVGTNFDEYRSIPQTKQQLQTNKKYQSAITSSIERVGGSSVGLNLLTIHYLQHLMGGHPFEAIHPSIHPLVSAFSDPFCFLSLLFLRK
mmetsp:Transcript_10784/g.25721  ORF Transcript_10784/g.25721 Transcript_10784/m.25721 type:complete len:91 (+) Transcript_10784:1670-1942(+)